MKNNLRALSLILGLVSSAAYADTTTTTVATSAPAVAAPAAATSTTAAAPKKEEAPSLSFGFTYAIEYDIPAGKQDDRKSEIQFTHEFKPTWSYGNYSGGIDEYYNQGLTDSAGNVSWTDPAFFFSRKSWDLGSYMKLGPSMGFVLPLTDASRNEAGMLYSISGGLKLSANTKNLGWDGWSLGHQVTLFKYYNQYDTNAKTGNPLNNYKIRNRLTFGYDFNDSWGFFNMFDFNSSYTYGGTVTNRFFSLQAINYTVNENVSLGLSHSNDASYLKAGTYENNLKFYDEETSTYAVSMEISI